MVTRKQLLILAIVGVVVLAPLTVLAVLFFPPGFMYDHHSSYSYTTSVSTNSTIENATILLPFPAGGDVGPDPISNLWIYDEEGNQMEGWNASIVETDHGPMLQLRTERLVGEERYVLWTYAPNGSVINREEIGADEIPEDMTNKELIPEPTTYSIAWQTTVDHDIETRHPIGNASFITPVSNVTPISCENPWDESDRCSSFTSVAAATYESDGSATVTLGEIHFEAWNEWGFWLSNSFNTFEATTTPAVYTDGRQGWTALDGELRAGMGRYDGPAR